MAWTGTLTITLGNATKKSEMDAAFDNTKFISTNVVPAASKAWFYQNTAPTGWTIDATPADALLAVKGGSQAYNANGGTQAGTWTQLESGSTTLTAAQSGLPAHTHPVTNIQNTITGVPAIFSGNDGSLGTQGSATVAANTAAAASAGHTHPAPANTWRPLAQLGIICTKDAYA